ncbi:MAG TPA: DNA-directed RNA polymerase subunit K [Thermoplasmata archaeon]|jgi:DNA-directed RNA polymerase subunit K
MRYSRFERARILGARALQISMGAPALSALPKSAADPIELARQELENGLVPLTVQRLRHGIH